MEQHPPDSRPTANMKRRVVKNHNDTEENGGSMTVTMPSVRSSNSASSNHMNNSSSKGTIIPLLLIIIGTLIGFSIYQKQQFQQHSLSIVQDMESREKYIQEKMNNEKQIEIHDKEIEFSKQIHEYDEKIEKLKSELNMKKSNDEELEKFQHDHGIVLQQLDHLREEMQRRDKNVIIEKFGEGPHKVEFQLDFPPDEVPEGTVDSFIIELAPVELVSTRIKTSHMTSM